MTIPIISTKLYIPPPRPNLVIRSHLIEQLNEGLHGRLTLISAPAGFGKTTLISEWAAGCDRPVAWLSMDEGDNDPACLLTYLVASLQTIVTNIGNGVLGLLQSPQPLPIESILTVLLNEITTMPDPFILILDDYHVINAESIDNAIALILERMPPQMHLVIATREDPRLPMAKLRSRNQLTEVRATDLRFDSFEATEFLGPIMGLTLSSEDIDMLESRTEGWIAGLQLAALSLRGHKDASTFIKSFTGSHHFVADYLVEEVLQQQSTNIQTFLLYTSVLDRLCGPLCDMVLLTGVGGNFAPSSSGQEILEYLERNNLFIVPLDNERRWYRYHHLFADLLRQRLRQSINSSLGDEGRVVAELNIRASTWYEDNGLDIEAFNHAVIANDIHRGVRLIEGEGMPLFFRGAVIPVMNWLTSMSQEEMDASPSLWVMFASSLLLVGQLTGVEMKLQAAEKALHSAERDEKTSDLIGHIASIRATLAVSKHQAETIIAESRLALANLHPDNLPVRTATIWALGYAYELQGDRTAAWKAYTEALSISQLIGHVMITIMATLGLGKIQEAENQLYVAAETYRVVLKLAGDPPMPVACEAHLGLARIMYEWNDLDDALQQGLQSVNLAQLLEQTDRVVAGEVVIARIKLAQGEEREATSILVKADHFARQNNFVNQIPYIADAQVLALLYKGNLAEAADVAEKHKRSFSQAKVHLAQGNMQTALSILETLRMQVEEKDLKDEQLKILVLMAVTLHAIGAKVKSIQILKNTLMISQPGGFIRIFINEGILMDRLLREVATLGVMPDYVGKILPEFQAEKIKSEVKAGYPFIQATKSHIEPLTGRELEVLHLIAQGLSNREISEKLFLALSTVKGHNQIIFEKLQVTRRTEAVACARKWGLL
ncbi:LuxR C-terminal-related transcriptional regulator [Paenibacillus antarcticus]|uniref:Transcriptional regulator n=1 Tax=Paenibacillus antarcticus TaxID=253703 RepID=A0A168LVI4_9BACL|nr:LuxR C-terminal-related transcriptional regulator [Paenibacillus antarcticus]OAB43894.1 transcriptional regulator [Paenibacillus antarcticus]